MLNGSVLVFVERIEGGVSLDDHALLDSRRDSTEFAKNGNGLFAHLLLMRLAFRSVDAVGQEHQTGRCHLADDRNKDARRIDGVNIVGHRNHDKVGL